VRQRRQDDPVLGLLLEVELDEDLDEGRHFDGLLVVDTMAAKGAGDLAAAAETWILWWLRRGVGGGGRAEGAHEDVVMVGHCGGARSHGRTKAPLWRSAASRATVVPRAFVDKWTRSQLQTF
jgi:hypothetical protein